MSLTLDLPILGLDSSFPDALVILHDTQAGKYACCCVKGVHGLACFSTESFAEAFAAAHGLTRLTCESVTFDEAREIAKGRPLPVAAIMLLDHPEAPEIHFVR